MVSGSHLRNQRLTSGGGVLLLTGIDRRRAQVQHLLDSCDFELRPKELQDATNLKLGRYVVCLVDLAFYEESTFNDLLCRVETDEVLTPVLALVSQKRFKVGRVARRASATTGRPVGEGLRSLFRQSQTPQLLVDPTTGYIVDANAAACAFYGFAPTELMRMRFARLRMPSRKEASKARRGERGVFRFRHQTAAGEERVVKVHMNPISFPGGPLFHALIQDVTPRVESEQKLKALAPVDGDPVAGPLAREQRAEQVLRRFKANLHMVAPSAPYQVKTVIECIHRHLFDSELSVRWVRDQCRITSNSFSQQFKEHQGETMRRYIERKRMEAAQQLLRHEKLRPSIISPHLGYRHYGSFARADAWAVRRQPISIGWDKM